MLIGIFSDVHSNLEALTTVLKHYEQREAPMDRFICLGDVVGYCANPNECCEIVREVAELTILGNHDAAVSGRMDYAYYYDAARNALDWHAKQLTAHHHEWLETLTYRQDDDELDVSYCHGSPVNLEDFEYVFNTQQANALIARWDELKRITFIGHSHLTKAFELDEQGGALELHGPLLEFKPGKKYIVTVGSVGQPRDNDNRACYGVFDTERQSFEYNRVEYDIRSAAQKIFDAELSSDFAKRLFFGI